MDCEWERPGGRDVVWRSANKLTMQRRHAGTLAASALMPFALVGSASLLRSVYANPTLTLVTGCE